MLSTRVKTRRPGLFRYFRGKLPVMLLLVLIATIQAARVSVLAQPSTLPLMYWPLDDSHRHITSYPNSEWTWAYLGLNPGYECPPFHLRALGTSEPYWRTPGVPYNEDRAQADPGNIGNVGCYSAGTGSSIAHEGTDIYGSMNDPVYSVAPGYVDHINSNGNNSTIEIEHYRIVDGVEHTWRVRYVHLKNDFPFMNGSVPEGAIIGYIGEQSHVHIEVESLDGGCGGTCITNPWGPTYLWIDRNNDDLPDTFGTAPQTGGETIVRVTNVQGNYVDVYSLPEGNTVQYRVAPGDVGTVTAGPISLPDGRILWEIHWLSGFYDLRNNPFVDSASYPTEIVGWSDEVFLDDVTPIFADVSIDNLFYPYVDMVFTHSIFNGFSDGTFRPSLNIRRGAWAKGVYNAARFTPQLSCGDFSDVPPNYEFYVEITTLKCLGIINGFSDDTFRPEEDLLRDQATKFIVNTLIELGGVRSVESCAQGVEQFPDVLPDNPFYDYIRCVRKLGIMSGFSDGTFRPSETVTRGQGTKMLTGGRSILYYARWNPNTILECGLVDPTQEIYPGDEVLVNCNLYGTRHLYGVQMTCTADPSLLKPQDVGFGNFFDTSLRFTLSPQRNISQGVLVGGISQKNPAWPLFGDSNNNFAVLEHEAMNPGIATLSCRPLLSDRDGFQLASTLADVEVTILPFGGINSGIVLAQGRVNHAGITVEADGPVNQTTTTDGSGHYSLNQLRGGEYVITADMNGYLPTCTTIELNGGGSIDLDATTIWGGDAVDNDIINIGDATLIGANFNSSTPPADARADINADGRINIQDMSIMAGNFGKGGCQDW